MSVPIHKRRPSDPSPRKRIIDEDEINQDLDRNEGWMKFGGVLWRGINAALTFLFGFMIAWDATPPHHDDWALIIRCLNCSVVGLFCLALLDGAWFLWDKKSKARGISAAQWWIAKAMEWAMFFCSAFASIIALAIYRCQIRYGSPLAKSRQVWRRCYPY